MKHRPSRGAAAAAACVAVLSLLSVVSQQARAANAKPEAVDAAIRKGVEYLYSMQKDGNWEHAGEEEWLKKRQQGGATAMACYALLAAGENPQDPRLEAGLNWLFNANMEGVYAVGMRAQVWGFLPRTPAVRQAMHRDAQILMGLVKNRGDAKGHYSYYNDDAERYDHSCSNYGVLGMWALANAGYEVPSGYWDLMDAAWRRHQLDDGSWSYIFNAKDGSGDPRLSMTTAGVATLFITQDFLYSMQAIACNGSVFDRNIEHGIRWVEEHFEVGGDRRGLYTLYNIERVGVASGRKYFGKIDWYQDGAAYLLGEQSKEKGHWPKDNGKVHETAWAVVFLVRGRAPVMMNKLDYASTQRYSKAKTSTWNQRPRDVANIAKWVGKQIERDLNWQIVNLGVETNDLHDAPILYISGKDALGFTPEEEEKLKRFVEEGGLVLGNADCGAANKVFADSFKKLGSKLFDYEFRPLPDEHPIYANQQYRRVAWKNKPNLLGLSNGVRELMLLFEKEDPARGWQTQAFLGAEREPLAQLAGNIFLYAVDKQNLRTKGETYLVAADSKVQGKRAFGVARLQYAGNWNPEPAGWRRLGNVMHNQFQTDLKVRTVKVGAGDLGAAGDAVAHLTGTTKLVLDEKAKQELKKYVAAGGTLLVDAAGGSSDFATSAETELLALFAKDKKDLGVVPVKHPAYAVANKIEEVEYRSFAKRVLGTSRLPRVRGIEVDGRMAVFFSAEDLSAGLVGQPVDGIYGYAPSAVQSGDDKPRMGATEIMTNLIVYAGNKGKAIEPTTRPAAKPAAKPAEKKAEPAKTPAK
jgi:hypothetical protein